MEQYPIPKICEQKISIILENFFERMNYNVVVNKDYVEYK